MNNINEACEKVLYSEQTINEKCEIIAKQISEYYNGEEVTLVSILNGSFMFTSDLIKKLEVPCRIDFLQVSTYGASTVSSGKFTVKKPLSLDIENKNVLIVEDIIDTGFTMVNLLNYIKGFNPKSVRICTLIDKPHRRTQDIDADYVCFTMENDEFIVGYGLDYAQNYRNLPYIAVLKEQIYN